jgi:hypothetical protein
VVDEGVREHAAEYAFYPALVSLRTGASIARIRYSEKFVWEHRSFDPLINAIAQYYKAKPHWAFIQGFTGGTDGRRSMAYAAFVRRYMDTCETWRSAYRLVLALVDEIDQEPTFGSREILADDGIGFDEARWDVVFTRLSGLQEYGDHAGISSIMWAADSLNGGLSKLDWQLLHPELNKMRGVWTDEILEHARTNNVFFPAVDDTENDKELE